MGERDIDWLPPEFAPTRTRDGVCHQDMCPSLESRAYALTTEQPS